MVTPASLFFHKKCIVGTNKKCPTRALLTLEMPHWGASNEYQQHTFYGEINKIPMILG